MPVGRRTAPKKRVKKPAKEAPAAPVQEGGHEIIAYHRRHHGSDLAELMDMPTIIREMSDEIALLISPMVLPVVWLLGKKDGLWQAHYRLAV